MYCNFCGKAIQDDAIVCAYCGRAIGTPVARRRLMRSRVERKIAGVCSGFAEYLDVDVTLVRVLTIIVTIMSGIFPGIVAYVVAWIVMPETAELYPAPVGQQVTNPQH
jgi:phage shock protein C